MQLQRQARPTNKTSLSIYLASAKPLHFVTHLRPTTHTAALPACLSLPVSQTTQMPQSSRLTQPPHAHHHPASRTPNISPDRTSFARTFQWHARLAALPLCAIVVWRRRAAGLHTGRACVLFGKATRENRVWARVRTDFARRM